MSKTKINKIVQAAIEWYRIPAGVQTDSTYFKAEQQLRIAIRDFLKPPHI